MLVDRGDGVGAMPAAQMAELAGHPQGVDPARRHRRLAGRAGGGDGRARAGAGGEVGSCRTAARCRRGRSSRRGSATSRSCSSTFAPRTSTRAAAATTVIRVRVTSPARSSSRSARLFAGPGLPQPAERVRELVGLPEGAAVVAYCHSGSRSALATFALRSAGYDARNYAGSWHEWSRHEELPLER